MAKSDSRLEAAQRAINSIGLGFDITQDIDFDNCKIGSRLILINEEKHRHLDIPGGVSIPNVPNSIKCVRGETIRVHSEVLTLQQMLEHFNQEMCLAGKTASGNFCASFGLSGRCIKELATIKTLSYDGWFIKRYAIELERYHGELHDHVKEAVPSSWDPEALARFIERFGTHVVVGVSMGGKDVIYVRQEDSSYLHPTSIQKLLKDTANRKFMDSADNDCAASEDLSNNREVSKPNKLNQVAVLRCQSVHTHTHIYNSFSVLFPLKFDTIIGATILSITQILDMNMGRTMLHTDEELA